MIDKIILYHGSYIKVQFVDLNKCYNGLDFGKGFYLTSSKQQAINFVPNSVSKAIRKGTLQKDFPISNGEVSKYELVIDPSLKIVEFPKADVAWLHFVAAHRDNTLFPAIVEKYADYDIVIGKIANDQTAATLNAYISGIYGTPGLKNVDEFTIRKLLPNKLKDQYCLRTQKAIQQLRFIGSEKYGDLKSNR